MPRKILDISPPTKKPQTLSPEGLEKKPYFPLWLKITLTLGLVFGAIIWLSLQSKLTLYLKPQTELVKFQQTLEVNISQNEVDFQKKIIPGRFFTQEKEKWQTFQATGQDFEEGKAQGIIRVYNVHTPPTPITLRAKTRFLSSEGGKIFRAPQKIYLPAAKIKNGKVIPSSVEVKVVAQEAGEDYNIGPSKFSVPGLAGTPFYYTIWAESESNMEGGFKREVKKVTSEDIENAKRVLKEKLWELAKNSLESEISGDFVLNEKAIFEEDSQISCLVEQEAHLSEFNCQGKIKLKGLGFRVSDLKEFATQFVLNKISSSKELYGDSLNLNFSIKSLIPEQGKMIIDLEIQAEIYNKIPQELFLSQIKGKSQTEIEKIVFENYPQIEKVKFKFWPFWIKIAPKNLDRIKIELTF
jgi:hypothetical protein